MTTLNYIASNERVSDFVIEVTGQAHSFNRKLAEAILIRKLEHDLNIQEQAKPLKVF